MFVGHLFIFFTSSFNFFSDLEPSKWTIYYFFISIYVYIILDNCDGKQARKTGNSSPLGLLFDHGCDSVNTSISTIAFLKIIGVTNPFYISIALISTCYGFHIYTWEEYYTGSLDFGVINPVNEGSVSFSFVILFVGIYGNKFWLDSVPYINYITYGEAAVISVFIFSIIVTILSIIKIRKYISFSKLFFDLLTFNFSIFCFVLILNSKIYKNFTFILICYIFSILFSRLTIMIQLSHISNEVLKQSYIFPWILNFLLIFSLFFISKEFSFNYYIMGIFLLSFIYLIYFTTRACIVLSNLWEIKVFKVKPIKLEDFYDEKV